MQKWKQAILSYLIPGLLLLLFALLMNGTSFLQRPTSAADDFAGISTRLTACIQNNDWETARITAGELRTAWQTLRSRLQLAAEKDKLEELDENMARLMALVETEDPQALAELYAAADHWQNISR